MSISTPRTSLLAFIMGLQFGLVSPFVLHHLPLFLYSPLDGGPIGYHPQLEASATNPDGSVLVKIFRQRNRSYSWYVGGEMWLKVYDSQNNLIYEELLTSDGAWDELNYAFDSMWIQKDFIRVSIRGKTRLIYFSQFRRFSAR